MGFVEPQGDINETKEEIILTVDLQGSDHESLLVDIQEDYAVIEADKAKLESQSVEKGKMNLKTVPFEYRLHLEFPHKVDPETAVKTFHNGVLEIRVKKEKP